MNNTFIALTIGPIYKTFLNVRKTREVWAASYLFSFIMKQIVLELKKAGIGPDRFIIPFVNDKALKYKGVGIFPDQLIFKSQPGDYDKLLTVKANAIKSFTDFYIEEFPGFEKFLNEYLRIYFIEKELPEGANIIDEMFKHLYTLELQNYPMSDESSNSPDLFSIFNQINNKKEFFRKNNFQDTDEDVEYKDLRLKDANGNVRFESVAEITSAELKIKFPEKYKELVNLYLWDNKKNLDKDTDKDYTRNLKKDTDEIFIEELKKEFDKENYGENGYKPYHKYIAIIKADGDKIGSTIANLKGDDGKLRKFSEGLLNWAFACDNIVREYGGIPIYIGGDDLLLFAPISCEGKNLIDLIDNIDTTFREAMMGFDKVSLSYGVSITYYKFPMFEAISKVDELLRQAKDYSDTRNAISIRVLKHSGSVFETVFRKSEGINTKKLIQNLIDCIARLEESKGKHELSFLNSVGYCLRDNEDLLKLIGKDKTRIENFFANNFDEYKRQKDLKVINGTMEERKPKANYLKKVEELLAHCFENESDITTVLPSVYSIIRISRFLKGLEDEK